MGRSLDERTGWDLEADLHTHTIASGHAYSTLKELAEAAAGRGLKMLAITDHGFSMPASPHHYHFTNLPRLVPRFLAGVEIIKGAEADIIDHQGRLDMPDRILQVLEWVGIGFHEETDYPGGSVEDNTQAMVQAMAHPLVDFIAHPANAGYPVDLETVVSAARKLGKPLEINNSAIVAGSKANQARYQELARLVKKWGGQVIISSDAHIYTTVGEWQTALEIAVAAGLDQSQVLNRTSERVHAYLRARSRQRQRYLTSHLHPAPSP